MKTRLRKRRKGVTDAAGPSASNELLTCDLLTPEEERELLTGFWECKVALVRALVRHFPRLRAHRPPLEPWPMALFIRKYCDEDTRRVVEIRRLYDRYIHYKHRLACANLRLAAHMARRVRHQAVSYDDLFQEAVCGLMQAIDRFDLGHRARLATYATWWIRQMLQIAVAGQSNVVSLSPFHVKELGLLQEETETLAHGGKHLPSVQELAQHAGIDLEHLTNLQIATRTPVTLDAVLHDDTNFQLMEAMADSDSNIEMYQAEHRETLQLFMEDLRPRERHVLEMNFGLAAKDARSLRQISDNLGITRQRATQIKDRALEKLRSSAERRRWEASMHLD